VKAYLNQIRLLVQKDIRESFRRPAHLLGALVFSGLLLFVFSLQLQFQPEGGNPWAPSFLWVLLLFASLFTMNRSFAKEQQNDCHWALLMAVEEKSALFLAKAAGNLLLLALVAILVVPLSVVLWDIRGPVSLGLFLVTLAAGLVGLSLVSTLLAGITWQAEGESVLLPVLALPISIPLLLGLVELTRTSLGVSDAVQPWLYLVLLFDTLFLLLPIVLFDYILEV